MSPVLLLAGAFFVFLGGYCLYAPFLPRPGAGQAERIPIALPLLAGCMVIGIGVLIGRLAFRAEERTSAGMNQLLLKNDRLDSGTWFMTALVFAILGLAALCGLVVANVRDPQARWMGPSVKYPQAIYLFLDALAAIVALGMYGLAVYKGKKFFDRTDQILIDGWGVHDLRAPGQKIAWSEITEVKGWFLYSGGIATSARLQLVTQEGATVAVDILGLDRDPKSIVKAAKAMSKKAALGAAREAPNP